ncbi:MAG: glycosyltransferase family 4 protein [Silvibacterium sp.]
MVPTCLHIIKSAQPECTGILRIVYGFAKHARTYGYEVSVLFLADGPLRQEIGKAGIPSGTVEWQARRSDLAGVGRVWRWLRKHPADIVHLHHGGLSARTLCRVTGAKAVVQHVHGQVLEPDLLSVSHLKFRAADAVIACSQAVADCLDECRAQVVYAGIDTLSFPPIQAPPSGPFRVGVLSRLVPLKNIEAVIHATSRIAGMGIDIQTEIGGGGPSEPSLRALVENLGVANRVRFLGWRNDVAELLESWHLLLMPSMHEGFPLAALEAMAAARPVVASRVGGLSELVVDGVTGILLAPGDTEGLVNSVAGLANDRQRAAMMGKRGWERVHAEFSNSKMAERMATLYDSLLQRNPQPGGKRMPASLVQS